MVQEDYVSLELAKKLFAIDFPQNTSMSYVYGELQPTHQLLSEVLEDDCTVAAPTLSMVQKWLRETHHIIIEIRLYNPCYPIEYETVIYKDWDGHYFNKNFEGVYDTYEKALIVGIEKVIKQFKG